MENIENDNVMDIYILGSLKHSRNFENLTFFVFALMKEKRLSALFNVISSYLKERETRYFFNEPIFQPNLYKFSFVSISILKLLNNFIYSNTTLTRTVFLNNF